MSQEQYNTLMSNLLREKHTLAKLRVELEGRREKLCRCCRKFGHLARNCRNKREGEKGTAIPQNKFEILSSRVMQCGIEEKTIRSIRVGVKCYKCREEGHKYRECPLAGRKKEKRVACPREGKAHQRREVRRVEGSKAARPEKGEVQREWKRTSVEKLRIRAEVYCGKGVLEEAQLLELGWMMKEVVVSYLVCERCRERGCHVEDNRGQGVIPWTKQKALSWCGCEGKRAESSAPTERKSAVKVERAARPREAKAQQSGAVTPYKRLGKISDILRLNNKNNQLERRVRPPKDVPLDAQSWT